MTTVSSDRATRLAALDFDYAAQPLRTVAACNLCGGTTFIVLTHRDRYGYPAEAHGCRTCGLVFLNPVMTAEGYADFYARTYRPLVSAYHGRLIDAHTIQGEQRAYAEERSHFLAPFVEARGLRRMLDIGGSTGVIAHALATRFGLEGTVLDPAPGETAEAEALGLETIEGLVETHDFGHRRFDLVVMCQTSDHLLDVSGTFRRVRELISDDGLLFMDVVDWRSAYLRNWSIEDAIKIDHPYYFSESTATAFLARAGFEILRVDYEADHLHVGYVCRPTAPHDVLPSAAEVDAQWREIRYVQNAPRAS